MFAPTDDDRWGTNQMRQRLGPREHLGRGNALFRKLGLKRLISLNLRRTRPAPQARKSTWTREGVSRVPPPPLSNAETAGIRTRHGRRRWMEDDPLLFNVNAGLGIDGKRYGEGIHEGWFYLAY
jgi:hypothetical protein